MRRKTERVLHAGLEFRPCRDERPHEPNVAPAIVAKILRGLLDGAFEDYGGAVIERMSQRRRGMNPFQAVLRKRQASKKGRPHSHGVNGGTHVVQETGQRQFRRARAASDGFLPLDQ